MKVSPESPLAPQEIADAMLRVYIAKGAEWEHCQIAVSDWGEHFDVEIKSISEELPSANLRLLIEIAKIFDTPDFNFNQDNNGVDLFTHGYRIEKANMGTGLPWNMEREGK